MTHPCPKCQSIMIRADCYDPGSTIALCGGEYDENGVWWVCTDVACEDGRKNGCVNIPAEVG